MSATVFPPVLPVIPPRRADMRYIFISYDILHIPYFVYKYVYIYIRRRRQRCTLAAEGDHDKIVETLVEAKADPCA
jgi:hypothetical protein